MNIKSSYLFRTLGPLLLFIVGCASTSSSKLPGLSSLPKTILQAKTTPLSFGLNKAQEAAVLQKIRNFRQVLKKSKLSDADWRLHDELLNEYTKLKSVSGTKILVPAGARISVHLPSFCLNADKAIPASRESFVWRHAEPSIPYFKNIIQLASNNPRVSKNDIQTLLWNLQSKVSWEEYPKKLQEILKSIDPNVVLKLPSNLKNRAKNALFDVISENIPGASTAQETISSIKGKFRDFDEIKKSLESMTSQYPLRVSDDVPRIEDSGLYAETNSHEGYSSQDINIYNPGDKAEALDLSEYYLEPQRKDVQRIGLAGSSAQILSELEDLLFGDMLRLGIGFTPGLNDFADAYELLSGHDFVTNAALSARERMLSGFGLVVGSGQGYRWAKRATEAPASFLRNFEEGFEKIGRKSIKLEQVEAKTLLNNAERSLAEERRASKIRTYTAEEANLNHVHQERPPYQAGTKVTEHKSIERDEWVRVHGPTNQKGAWLMRKESVEGLSATEIQTKYSIKLKPTHISDVQPPVGTTIRRGRVRDNFGGRAGAVQYEILDDAAQSSWFKNMRPLDGK